MEESVSSFLIKFANSLHGNGAGLAPVSFVSACLQIGINDVFKPEIDSHARLDEFCDAERRVEALLYVHTARAVACKIVHARFCTVAY